MFLKVKTASGEECEHRQHAYKPSDSKHKYKQIGRTTKIRQFLTMDSDYNEYPGETDNNGNTKAYHSVVLPGVVGVALPDGTANAGRKLRRGLIQEQIPEE